MKLVRLHGNQVFRRHMSNSKDHLHLHRRSARSRHLLAAADHPGLHAGRWHRGRDARHLSCRSDPRQLSGESAAERRQPDDLAELGALAKTPRRQHHQAAQHQRVDPAAEGRDQGAAAAGLSPFPTIPRIRRPTRRSRSRREYARVLGSAVNPVLREGNSDRRVATSVKQYARSHPHSMGAWSKDSKSHVSSMAAGDFYANEKSAVITEGGTLRIELVDASGKVTVLKDGVAVTDGDVLGASMHEPPRAHRVLHASRSTTPSRRACCCRCTSRRR